MEKLSDLKVSPDGRFIIKEDGAPFFWLADTAWEIFHKLTREEALEYLATRATQQFSVIQAVTVCEFDGLNVPNSYSRTPFLKNKSGEFDPALPDIAGEYSYWDHVDFIIDTACSLGLYIGFLPTWGDKFNLLWGKGPVIFTPENAYVYGKWIGARYKDRGNIVWIMGGDRSLENDTHRQIVNNMAKGIKESTGGRHLMTFHPWGNSSSSDFVQNEPWLDFNLLQSGHDIGRVKNHALVQKDYALSPVRPVIDGEPRYEDTLISVNAKFDAENGFFDDWDARVMAYWAMLSGACGHTYGHHSVWSFYKGASDLSDFFPPGYFLMDWRAALHRPGAEQMRHLKGLILSRPFMELVPCQELLAGNYSGMHHIAAAKGKKHAFIYTPSGLEMKIKMGILEGRSILAYWFNPKKGGYTFVGLKKNEGIITFSPPSSGRNNDWVLVLDATETDVSR
ncbi:MAG: glycoside hydrolase family 140 protein [Treponema sp.]|jgi:hypothetical protein|nr:glycoside hydrolase family 140 protein [Treponema sp.]